MKLLKAAFFICMLSTIACSQKQNVQNTNSNEFQYPSLDHGVTTISDYEICRTKHYATNFYDATAMKMQVF